MALVTLEQAKRRLRILHAFEDVDVQEALDEAQALVFDYIKRAYEPATDDADLVLRSAVLKMLSHIWEDDPDNGDTGNRNGHLPPDVSRLLVRKRDPALA
ncbi:head-tail joining protein [Rhizobium phage RHph_X2_26]|nr:head-tail joining protein [Rhizobium phage RHph_X2_26]